MRWESIWREKGFVKGATCHVARNWAEKKCGRARAKEGVKEAEKGEGHRLSVGDPGMLILFVCLPPMIKLF